MKYKLTVPEEYFTEVMRELISYRIRILATCPIERIDDKSWMGCEFYADDLRGFERWLFNCTSGCGVLNELDE